MVKSQLLPQFFGLAKRKAVFPVGLGTVIVLETPEMN